MYVHTFVCMCLNTHINMHVRISTCNANDLISYNFYFLFVHQHVCGYAVCGVVYWYNHFYFLI